MNQTLPAMKTLKCSLLGLMLIINAFAQNQDIDVIKKRIVADLMNVTVNDKNIEAIMSKMNDDGSFSTINYTDLSRTASFPHGGHTRDLVVLARAYQTSTSQFYKNPKVKELIVKGLEFWVKNDFVGDNWHDNQITTPTNLGNLMLLIGNELPKDLVEKAQPMIGRAHMEASGARPSGDRIVIAGILAKNLLFRGDLIQFDKVIKIIEGEMKFSTGERGLQHDYSFHHREDRVNNTSSYGYGKYANAYGEWSYYVAGTRYAFSPQKINQLVDYYLEGIYKQQVYGIYEDISVKNRSISQKVATFQPQSTLEIERLLTCTDYRKNELEYIIKLRKGEAKPTASFAKFFWQTEHFVFQRPRFYTTVRMFSTRNRNMEEPYNGPGKTTHHRADGTNYLMLRGDEYHNIWAVYDWQKISGTTILQKPQLPGPEHIQKDGLTEYVGAATDGLYGAVMFDFKSPHDGTEAKKSWFFFDEEYVCLGTDIKAKSELSIASTINQTLLRSEVSVGRNNNTEKLPKNRHSLQNIKWVHHNNVGYVFPKPTDIQVSNQTETGRWSDITDQKNISKEVVSEEVFKLWFDHGKKPKDASYQYIVVPNVSVENLEEKDRSYRQVEVLSNTSHIQAVKHLKLGMTQAVFYKSATIAIAQDVTLRMDSPGVVLLQMQGQQLKTLTVADPSRRMSRMAVTVSGIYKAKGDHFVTLPDATQKQTIFLIDLPQGVEMGKSVSVKL